jgi:hypothetical protein
MKPTISRAIAVVITTFGFPAAEFGLGVALANAGFVTREDIAAAMAKILQQQEAQQATPARTFAVRAMVALFSREVVTDPKRRFGVVDSGRQVEPPDDPPRAA